MKYKIYLLCLFVMIFISCENEAEEFKSEFILHGLLIEGQKPKIILSKTLDAFPKYAFDIEYYNQKVIENYQRNIDISIFNNNYTYNDFNLKKFQIYNNDYWNEELLNNHITYFVDENLIPKTGEEYTIDIKELQEKNDNGYKLGFYHLKASTYIPARVPIKIDSWDNNNNNYYKTCNFSFDDPATDNNYYFIEVYDILSKTEISLNSINLDSLVSINNDDNSDYLIRHEHFSIIDDNLNSILNHGQDLHRPMNDDKFNGQNVAFEVSVKKDDLSTYNHKYLFINLMHLSSDFYNYYNSISQQTFSQRDVYTEPTIVYSNIENGIGIFAGASVDSKLIKIDF